ncbi:hypothetical protein GWI33_012891 [Rhynchophorus ferrugineus]|uniref:Cyclin C-terminal domain-containing protein n=1 Tax=Rhynchophorus ferrugineus TaxID=354439 RepID=A0A834MC26_RHYFE|nr:hypothetical protein GWI33_012891 [Rhynchophorus ferrugineus]
MRSTFSRSPSGPKVSDADDGGGGGVVVGAGCFQRDVDGERGPVRYLSSAGGIVRYHPSILACSSIASALLGLGWLAKSKCTSDDLLQQLTDITKIERDYILECLRQIELMLKESAGSVESTDSQTEESSSLRPDEFTPPPKNPEIEVLTPTDVHDVYF